MSETAASIASFWDAFAASFDEEADHGLRDPGVRAAWAQRLRSWMPASPADVLDLGCGTGSLSLVLAEQGHRPVGVDLAPLMVGQARRKLTAAGFDALMLVGDASNPPAEAGSSFDVILSRHLLWTLPDPEEALRRWIGLLRPGGRLVLIEGRWASAEPGEDQSYAVGSESLPWMGGVEAERLLAALRPLVETARVEPLPDPALWGRTVHDERYAVVAFA
ncbi:class I SAM-dependent methyltransferase [Planomonospora parontospora]|uniref:class I SAM-dependent methyltransferase n=1 Tax=Planomonospora parontospora TaxID=58119 RepID=UPI00166F77AF|nr:class I SAM-dependent methyltransferase [Planomonospora parontospora]GGL30064.1 SAM-dependent methyltransferase [Planomonospora parontospora subsp. antibiotica]GII17752.1 SAM-dependent methyltransferase [Planomonospora parontospora subsp. antibiotica]